MKALTIDRWTIQSTPVAPVARLSGLRARASVTIRMEASYGPTSKLTADPRAADALVGACLCSAGSRDLSPYLDPENARPLGDGRG